MQVYVKKTDFLWSVLQSNFASPQVYAKETNFLWWLPQSSFPCREVTAKAPDYLLSIFATLSDPFDFIPPDGWLFLSSRRIDLSYSLILRIFLKEYNRFNNYDGSVGVVQAKLIKSGWYFDREDACK